MRYFCFILSSLIFFLTCAQKPSVSLIVDNKNVQAGDLVTFTVKSNVEGNVEIIFPDEFIRGYGTTSGMEQEMDYNSGSVNTIYYFAQNGTFKQNGTYTIQAFIKNRKTVYKSNKVTIKVEKTSSNNDDEITKKNLKQPVFGIIKKSKNQIYEGEALVVEAKVYSRLDINMLEAYQEFEVDGGAEKHEMDKSQRLLLSKENYKGSNFLTFSYGKQLIFPNQIGKVKIKPFEMALQYSDGGIFSERIAFTSSSSTIEVIALPNGAPKSFIGAVGKFDFNYDVNKKNAKEGDVIVLTVVVSGVGNLQNTNKPELKLPKGIVIYGDPEIKEDFEYTHAGAEGKITYTYNLQINSDQVSEIPALSIAYFDPNEKKYVVLKGERINLFVKENPSFQATILPETSNEKPKKQQESLTQNKNGTIKKSIIHEPWFWTSVLSPLALAFLGILFWKKNKSTFVENKQKNVQKNELKACIFKLDQIDFSDKVVAYQSLETIVKNIGKIYSPKQNDYYTKADLFTELKNQGIDSEIQQQLANLLNQCEEARFSFSFDENHLKQKIEEAKQIIQRLV